VTRSSPQQGATHPNQPAIALLKASSSSIILQYVKEQPRPTATGREKTAFFNTPP
jgi:hypothetical protein